MAGTEASTPCVQAWYPDAAIEPVLMLRLVFHLALRQAECFAASVLRLLGQDLRVPDHTTLTRRSRGSAGRRPEVVQDGPVHLVIDSTGLKLFGRGEWDAETHLRPACGARARHVGAEGLRGPADLAVPAMERCLRDLAEARTHPLKESAAQRISFSGSYCRFSRSPHNPLELTRFCGHPEA